MTHIGIVGAGAAAAAATFVLDGTLSDADVTVLEKSGGLCGRAATRRHGELTYDYGANYIKDGDERVVELLTETLDTEGLVDIEEPIYTFDAEGTVSPGRAPDGRKWSYRRGITQVAKRLLSRTDATVQRRTRVDSLQKEKDNRWTAVDTQGTEWGPFDVVVLNPPAPQTAALLDQTAWDSPVCAELADAARAVEYRTIWTAVLHYEFELDVPYYGLINPEKDHEVGWISREECKPGHVPDGESLLVVQASQEWSAAHYDADPTENVTELAGYAAEILGDDRLTTPAWTDRQGWRYALPEEGVDTEPLTAAEHEGLYCLGDWVAGEARVHAALANGLTVGERIAADASS